MTAIRQSRDDHRRDRTTEPAPPSSHNQSTLAGEADLNRTTESDEARFGAHPNANVRAARGDNQRLSPDQPPTICSLSPPTSRTTSRPLSREHSHRAHRRRIEPLIHNDTIHTACSRSARATTSRSQPRQTHGTRCKQSERRKVCISADLSLKRPCSITARLKTRRACISADP